jgi:hypothetical protein
MNRTSVPCIYAHTLERGAVNEAPCEEKALDAKAAVSGEAISQQKVDTWVKWAAAGREAGQHANGRVQLRAGKAIYTSLDRELDEHAHNMHTILIL